MILEKIYTKEVMHIVVRSIFSLGNLLKDNRSFTLDLFAVEIRIEENIGQQIACQRQIFIKHLGVVAGVFLGSKGVQQAAHGIHLFGDLRRCACRRSLEKQMFDEMGYAILIRQLMAGTILNPNS